MDDTHTALKLELDQREPPIKCSIRDTEVQHTQLSTWESLMAQWEFSPERWLCREQQSSQKPNQQDWVTTIAQWKTPTKAVQEWSRIKFQVCSQCLGKRITQRQSVKPVRKPMIRLRERFSMRLTTTVESTQIQCMISTCRPGRISSISRLKEELVSIYRCQSSGNMCKRSQVIRNCQRQWWCSSRTNVSKTHRNREPHPIWAMAVTLQMKNQLRDRKTQKDNMELDWCWLVIKSLKDISRR